MANTSTVINAFQKFYAADGVTPLGAGTATFYENKTTTLASIFSDPALTVAQTNPYTLDAGGRITGDVRFSGTLSILLKDSAGGTIRTDDDNVCFTTSSSFVTWDAAVTYSTGDLVEGSDGLFYISIANTNLNNDPAAGASPTKWSQIKFVGVWNTNQSYLIRDVVQGSGGLLYYAISAQSGNDPVSSAAQWRPLGDLLNDLSPQLSANLSANGQQIQLSKGADVISATALPLLTDGNSFDVTGTTTITSFNTTAVGNIVHLHFDAALLLTHSATDLVLLTAANITTVAGDEATFLEYASGDYRMLTYSRASGAPLNTNAGFKSLQVFTSSGTWNRPADITLVKITCTGGGGGGGGTDSGVREVGGAAGAGATAIDVADVTSLSSATITIGAAGAVTSGASGGTGGTSSFDALAVAAGGLGGVFGSGVDNPGGIGGAASAGDIQIDGGGGQAGYKSTADITVGPMGGSSYWGGGANGNINNVAAAAGEAFGSGGAGRASNSSAGTGGLGKAGIIIVEEYK